MRVKLFATFALLVVGAAACTLPGVVSPTPFTFPTPDLTLTALFAPSSTPEQPTSTQPSLISVTPEPETSTAQATEAVTGTAVTSPSGQQTRPQGEVIEAQRLQAPPTIDGNLTEWTMGFYAVDEVAYGAENWTGQEDASGQLYLGWDAQNLYLAVRVTDDSHVQIATGRYMYRGDIVEMQLDADLAGDFNNTLLTADDFQIGLSPGDFAGLTTSSYRWYPRSVAGGLTTVEISAVATDTGYNLEARIPWIVFGVSPTSGGTYGFALSISDNDRSGSAVQQSLISTLGSRMLANPTTWGTLRLAP